MLFDIFLRMQIDTLTLDATKPVVPFFEKEGLLTSAMEE